MPTRFGVGSNEIVLWVIGNTSGQPIRVTLQTFLRDNNPADSVDPFVWLVPFPIEISDGQIGLIAGVKHPGYLHKHLVDRVKYTIRVQGGFPTVDYDPDGDIKP